MSLEQILKAATGPVLAAGLIAGILHFSHNAKTPVEDKKYTVEFSELAAGNSTAPKKAVFEDEKTYRKFADLTTEIEAAYKDELEVRGLQKFGQKEDYEIIEMMGKNAPYELITSEQVDKAVYSWKKEGKKAFNITIKTPSKTNPNLSSLYYFEHDENGHYLVLGQYGRQWKTKVEDTLLTAAFIDKMQRKDPLLENRDYYNFKELRSLVDAISADGEITKYNIQEAGKMKGLKEILEHPPK